jgi:murein DD-endopeptidase MepM/ murein hydrolase activator NlpD
MTRARSAAVVCASAAALIATAGATFGRPPVAGEPAVPTRAELRVARAQADTLSARLDALESRLGLVPPRSTAQDTGFRARYARLREREAAVARRAEAWLRFVPGGAPVPGGVVTSAFSPGRYHPIRHRVIPHVGVDVAAPHGTPVHATADGSVFATADNPTYGLTVDLRHGDSGFLTRYAHLSRIAVRPGQPVRRGDVIGWVGSTGLSTGPHTHYEVFYQGWRRDPIDFMPPGPVAGEALSGVD